jgi:hypothetical protein
MKFSEVSVGQKFKVNEVTFAKTEQVKVSCCRSVNALKQENNEKVFFKPDQEVELVTE